MNPLHTPEVTMALLRKALPWIAWMVTGREFTKRGIPHFHMHIEFRHRHAFTSIQVQNAIGQFGHLSYINEKTWLEYLLKFGDWVTDGINAAGVKEIIEPGHRLGETMTEQMVRSIQEGAKEQEIAQTYPTLYFRSQRTVRHLIDQARQHKQLKDEMNALLPFEPIQLKDLKYPDLPLAKYLNWITLSDKKDKKQHLFLFGPTNSGKTRFLTVLKKFFRVYHWMSSAGNFQANFLPPYDFIVFDEFCDEKRYTGRTIQELNAIMDGIGAINQKGVPAETMSQHHFNPPCIFVANDSPYNLFARDNMPVREAFVERFHLLEVSQRAPLRLWHQFWDPLRITLEGFNDHRSTSLKVGEVIQGVKRMREPETFNDYPKKLDPSATESSSVIDLHTDEVLTI